MLRFVNTCGSDQPVNHVGNEYLIAVDVLALGFGKLRYGADKVGGNVGDVGGLSLGGFFLRRRSKREGTVFDQRRTVGEIAHCFFDFLFRRGRRYFFRSKADGFSVFRHLVDLDGNMFHILGAVLVKLVTNEVEFPAVLFNIVDLPAVNAGSVEYLFDFLQHYPNLAFVLR